MAKKKKYAEEEEHSGGEERWLLTYSDMITLLMIFFIVMYSISVTNVEKFNALAQQLSSVIGNGQSIVFDNVGNGVLDSIAQQNPGADTGGEAPSMADTRNMIENLIEEHGLSAHITGTLEERGYVIRLKESLLFEAGSADINEDAKEIVGKMAKIISLMPNDIRVEGHTDDLPINTFRFPSNWELASQRAINVTKLLIQNGMAAERMSVLSYGEYRPIVPNDDQMNMQINRRVNIVIMDQKYDDLEEPHAD